MRMIKILSTALLSLAFIFQMLVIVPSGSEYCSGIQCGIFFWGAHEHDSVWHLAVSSTLLNQFPFEMPNMSGTLMQGYNFLYDIVVAGLSLVTTISVSVWFFKILPVVWFISMSYVSYLFAKTYRKSNTFPLFIWFFTFFGSSFSYIISILNKGNLWGASSLLSMQSLQDMLNPQFAWSLIPLLLLLIGINLSKRSQIDYLKYGTYVMIAIGLKFYTGTAMLLLIGVDLLLQLIKNPKTLLTQIINGLIVAIMTAVSVVVFYGAGSGAEFPFIFKPLATVNPIIEDKSLLYLPKWAERLYSFTGVRLLVLESIVLLVFIVLNYGSRVLALFGFLKHDELSDKYTRKLLIFGSIGTMLLSTFLTQRGVWWNTVQFLYVSLFLTGILAAEGLDALLRTKKLYAYVLIGFTILLTIPANLDVVKTFAKFPGTAYISHDEVEALVTLEKYDDGVVLTPMFEKGPSAGELIELGKAYDTAYISSYSKKQTYLSDLIQLELTNVDYKRRLEMISGYDCQVLEEITYAYEYKDRPYVDKYEQCGVKLNPIIENNQVKVYRVNK